MDFRLIKPKFVCEVYLWCMGNSLWE